MKIIIITQPIKSQQCISLLRRFHVLKLYFHHLYYLNPTCMCVTYMSEASDWLNSCDNFQFNFQCFLSSPRIVRVKWAWWHREHNVSQYENTYQSNEFFNVDKKNSVKNDVSMYLWLLSAMASHTDSLEKSFSKKVCSVKLFVQ